MMIGPQYFLHVANILFVVSYSVRDIMLLRVFALCGSLISIPYYYLQANVLWQPIGWAAIFMMINGYHVWRLWRERRPIELSSDEAKLYELTFFPLTRRRFRDLVRLGRWADLKAGDVLIRPGQPIDEVFVPLTDSIDARMGERLLGRFAAGEIVGAAAFYGHPPRFEAVACVNCRTEILAPELLAVGGVERIEVAANIAEEHDAPGRRSHAADDRAVRLHAPLPDAAVGVDGIDPSGPVSVRTAHSAERPKRVPSRHPGPWLPDLHRPQFIEPVSPGSLGSNEAGLAKDVRHWLPVLSSTPRIEIFALLISTGKAGDT
jgi:hypothetical protein